MTGEMVTADRLQCNDVIHICHQHTAGGRCLIGSRETDVQVTNVVPDGTGRVVVDCCPCSRLTGASKTARWVLVLGRLDQVLRLWSEVAA